MPLNQDCARKTEENRKVLYVYFKCSMLVCIHAALHGPCVSFIIYQLCIEEHMLETLLSWFLMIRAWYILIGTLAWSELALITLFCMLCFTFCSHLSFAYADPNSSASEGGNRHHSSTESTVTTWIGACLLHFVSWNFFQMPTTLRRYRPHTV